MSQILSALGFYGMCATIREIWRLAAESWLDKNTENIGFRNVTSGPLLAELLL